MLDARVLGAEHVATPHTRGVARELSALRVAFIAGTLGQGGAERQLFYMLRALRNVGADVRVLCLTQNEFWEERIRDLGIAVKFLGGHASRLARLVDIIAELRLYRPHIVQSQHFYTNIYASLAARALHVPEIGAIRNDVDSEVKANGRVLGRWSLRLPRVVAANSRLGISNALRMGVSANRVRFLPNVVDTDNFAPSSPRAPNGLHLLAVGRLVEQKRFDRFLEIVARTRAGGAAELRATIVGVGPLRATLEAQARALGLASPVVEFAGAVSDMRPLYANADVLVLTSEWEGTPNVLLEAMASGLPIVSTSVGGVPDIVKDHVNGILISGGTDGEIVDAFCNEIAALANYPAQRTALATSARDFVVQQHSVRALTRVLSELYDSVLS